MEQFTESLVEYEMAHIKAYAKVLTRKMRMKKLRRQNLYEERS